MVFFLWWVPVGILCSLCEFILSVAVTVMILALLGLIPLVLLSCALLHFASIMSRPFVGVLAALRRGESIDSVSAFLFIACIHSVNYGVLLWYPCFWIAFVGVIGYFCCAMVGSAALFLVFLTSACLCLDLFMSRWCCIWFAALLRRPLSSSVVILYLLIKGCGNTCGAIVWRLLLLCKTPLRGVLLCRILCCIVDSCSRPYGDIFVFLNSLFVFVLPVHLGFFCPFVSGISFLLVSVDFLPWPLVPFFLAKELLNPTFGDEGHPGYRCPQGSLSKVLKTPPDGDCFYYCMAAYRNLECFLSWRQQQTVDGWYPPSVAPRASSLARDVRDQVVLFMRSHGANAQADRLLLSGYDGWPDEVDFKFFSAYIGVAFEIVQPMTPRMRPLVYGTGRVGLRLQRLMLPQGCWHYEVVQIWAPSDIRSWFVSAPSGRPVRRRILGKRPAPVALEHIQESIPVLPSFSAASSSASTEVPACLVVEEKSAPMSVDPASSPQSLPIPSRKASLQDLDDLSPVLLEFCRVARKQPGSLRDALRDFLQKEQHLSVTEAIVREWLSNNGFGRPASQAASLPGETVVSRAAELNQFADSLRAWQASNYGYKRIRTLLHSELSVRCSVQSLRTWLANHPLDARPAEVLSCLCVNIHIYIYTYIHNMYKYIHNIYKYIHL